MDGQLRREDGNFMVTMNVRIPIGEVTLVPAGDTYVPRVSLYVQVIDEKGKTSPVNEQFIPIEIRGADIEEARGKYWTYALKLLMEPGEHRVAVAIRDDLSGESSLVTRVVDVGG